MGNQAAAGAHGPTPVLAPVQPHCLRQPHQNRIEQFCCCSPWLSPHYLVIEIMYKNSSGPHIEVVSLPLKGGESRTSIHSHSKHWLSSGYHRSVERCCTDSSLQPPTCVQPSMCIYILPSSIYHSHKRILVIKELSEYKQLNHKVKRHGAPGHAH